jgi:hypothetical protein
LDREVFECAINILGKVPLGVMSDKFDTEFLLEALIDELMF